MLLMSICIIWALEEEKAGWATFTLAVTLAACIWLGDTGLIEFLSSWTNILTLAGVYFGAGILWGFIKWCLFLTKRLDEYETLKVKFLHEHGIEDTKEVPNNLKKDWKDHCISNGYSDPADRYNTEKKVQVRPRAWQHKGKILTWMCYWPWSLLWSLLDDVVKAIWRRLYRYIGDMLENMSKRVFKNVDADFEESKPLEAEENPGDDSARQ